MNVFSNMPLEVLKKAIENKSYSEHYIVDKYHQTSCLKSEFGSSPVQIPSGSPTIVTANFRDLPQCFQENTGQIP
jgi:hypothetical protein